MPRNFSNEPDTRIIAFLQPVTKGSLLLAGGIGGLTLLLWLIPALAGLVPAVWLRMTPNTAVGLLLSTYSLSCSFRYCSPTERRAGIAAALAVLLLGLLNLAEYAAHGPLGLDFLLQHSAHSPFPVHLSPQPSSDFVLLAITMLTMRQAKNGWSRLSDISALLFVSLNLVMLGGYVYGALDQINFDAIMLLPPQSLLAVSCLGTVLLAVRAEQGDLLAVLVNIGIGSRIVRLLMPGAFIIPFIFLASETYLRQNGTLSAPYVEALASASASILSLCVVTWMGWRINALERDLRDQSLTDELTGVYNRRGFYFLGQQAIREAERAHAGLTVFFFDLDGLKRVNDLHGHEIGSEMIKEFAGILNTTFRKSDIVGRVGGDEFAVITIRESSNWPDSIYDRLDQLANAHNATNGEIYRLSYSIGYSELRLRKHETLEDVITRADALMYVDKAKKKLAA